MLRPTRLLSLLTLPVLGLTLLAPAARPADGDVWMPDLGPALEKAAAEDKDLLVDFTGSDWCGWCIKLHDEVFGEEEFLEWATERYVLVALDFPQKPDSEGSKRMTPELRARNEAEQAAFAVQGFPTILLMTSDGVAYARTGYQRGGVEPYIKHLEEFEAGRTKIEREAAVKLIAQVGDDPAEAELEAAYSLAGNLAAARQDLVLDVVRRLDPKDSRLVLAQAAMDQFMKDYLMVDEEPDWDAVARVMLALPETTPSIERLPLFFFYRGVVGMQGGDAELARDSLEKMKALDGDLDPRMLQTLEMMVATLDS